jgi:hypothetical protein
VAGHRVFITDVSQADNQVFVHSLDAF